MFELSGGDLRIATSEPNRSDTATRVEAFLRAWEFQAELRFGYPVLEFVPPDAVFPDEQIAAGIPSEASADEGLIIEWSSYPEPPSIRFVPELHEAWRRFREARLGIGEPVQSATYFLLTVLDGLGGGGRRKAANGFGVSFAILRKIGELSTVWSDSRTRKSVPGDAPRLTARHERWLETSIRLVLLHVGAAMAGADPPRLEMADLPDFPAAV